MVAFYTWNLKNWMCIMDESGEKVWVYWQFAVVVFWMRQSLWMSTAVHKTQSALFTLPAIIIICYGHGCKINYLMSMCFCGHIDYTLAAGLRIYRTWKSGKKQGYFGWLTNRTDPQPIALESCSNPQEARRVRESGMKKFFLVLGFVFLWVMSAVR